MGILCRVNSCCCGATLRTGSLIIAIVEAIAIGVFLLTTALSVIALDALPEGDLYNLGELVLSAANREVIRNVSIAAGVINGVLLFANFCLMYGIVNFRHSFFIPWFIFEVVMVITNIVTSILFLVLATAVFNEINLVANVFYLIAFALLRIYFYIVIYSYYCTLKEQKDNPNMNIQAGPTPYPNMNYQTNQTPYPNTNYQTNPNQYPNMNYQTNPNMNYPSNPNPNPHMNFQAK